MPVNSKASDRLSSIFPTIRSTRRRKIDVSDAVVQYYMESAQKGEKKTEAGIKYWFERNIPGHETEYESASGKADGYTPGWLLLELKGKQIDWISGFFEGLSRVELNFQILVVISHKVLLIFPGTGSLPEDWSAEKRSQWLFFTNYLASLSGSASAKGAKAMQEHRKKQDVLRSFAIFDWEIQKDDLLRQAQSHRHQFDIFKNIVSSIDTKKARIEITPKNFSTILQGLLQYFETKDNTLFEVVHGFFRCLSYWNPRYNPIAVDDPAESDRVVIGGGYFEGLIPEQRFEFIKDVQFYEARIQVPSATPRVIAERRNTSPGVS